MKILSVGQVMVILFTLSMGTIAMSLTNMETEFHAGNGPDSFITYLY